MKNRNILAALLIATGLLSGSAFAHGNDNAGAVAVAGGIAGQATVYGGTVAGSAGVVSSGNATTAAAGSGNFASNQNAGGSSVGTAFAGGSVAPGGVTVVGTTSQATNSYANGTLWGAAATNAQGQFLNGGTSYDTTQQAATAAGTFQSATIGADAAIAAFAGFEAASGK